MEPTDYDQASDRIASHATNRKHGTASFRPERGLRQAGLSTSVYLGGMTLAVPGATGFVALAQRAVIGSCAVVSQPPVPGRSTGFSCGAKSWSDPERHPTQPQETGTDNTHRVFVTHRGSKPLSVAPGRDPVDAHPTHAIERTLRPLLSGTNSWQTAGGGV